MNTLQHGFWIYFIARKVKRRWYYVLGAMFPDAMYIAGLLYLLFTGQIPWQEYGFWTHPVVGISYLRSLPWVGWGEFSGHSVIIWLAAGAFSLVFRWQMMRAFVMGWGSHLVIDILTHVTYTPYLLYPLSWQQFPLGLSYWDLAFHGREFQLVQSVTTVLAISYLIYEYWLYWRSRKSGKRSQKTKP